MSNKYNFETVESRFDVGSKKWDEIDQYCPEVRKKGEDIIPFSVADMEFETAPSICEGMKKYIDHYVLGYSNPTPAFFNAVCDWMYSHHDWEIQPDWVLTTSGVITAFFMAVKTFTDPGDGVVLMTPVYYPMYSAIRNNNRKLVENPLINHNGHYEIDFEDLEQKVKDPNTKLLIFCSPHNPAGRVWTRRELEKVGRICIDNHVLIASDEIHFDLIMPGYHHTVFASISEEFAMHSITMTAASKSFNLAGMQTSCVIIPNKELRDAFHAEQLLDEVNPKSNILGYEATRLAYTECGEWFDRALAVIDHNRQTVVDFMAKEFPEVIVTPLEGTYLLWMDIRPLGIDYKHLAEILRTEGKLFFDDGYIFGTPGEGFERWNLACPTRYVEEALLRLKGVLNKHRKD